MTAICIGKVQMLRQPEAKKILVFERKSTILGEQEYSVFDLEVS